MWKQSILTVATLGMFMASAQAQVVEGESPEAKKTDAKKADATRGVRAYAIQIADGDASSGYRLLHDLSVPFAIAGEYGKYWVGVQCHPASAALRAQLGLDKDTGLVVGHVVKGGSAAKAGIKQHDILVAIGDTKLANQQQLSEQIEKAEGKALKFKLLRSGKEKTLEVTPAERKAIATKPEATPSEEAVKKAIEWLKRHQGDTPDGEWRIDGAEGKPLTLRWLGPGVIVGGEVKAGSDMPKGLSVSITRTAGEPAKIIVNRGDKTWELKEGELDKLPKELRPHVKRLMSGPRAAFDIKRLDGLKADTPLGFDFRVEKLDPRVESVDPTHIRAKVLRHHTETDDDVKKQMREMNERLEKMQEELRKLLEKQGEK